VVRPCRAQAWREASPVARDYSYDTDYESSPEQKRNRAARGRARYEMMKLYGKKAIEGKDIDHIHAMATHGVDNERDNLRIRSIHENRGDKTF
jgi:hypothetical protein